LPPCRAMCRLGGLQDQRGNCCVVLARAPSRTAVRRCCLSYFPVHITHHLE